MNSSGSDCNSQAPAVAEFAGYLASGHGRRGKTAAMNHAAVLLHLREARQEIERTIAQIEGDAYYDTGEFKVAMSHLYHHLNTAWNGRTASDERHRECAPDDFNAWRKFPDHGDFFL